MQRHFPTAIWIAAMLFVVLLSINQSKPGCHVLLDEFGNVAGYAYSPAGGSLFIAGAAVSAMLPPVTLFLFTNRSRTSLSTILKMMALFGASLAYARTEIVALGALGMLIMVGRCILLWLAIVGISAVISILFQRVTATTRKDCAER